jgi:hypothetical protein
MRRCVFRGQLDLETLVATRGLNFPISRLESRLMCPTCGNKRVTVLFEPPRNVHVGGGKATRLLTGVTVLLKWVRPNVLLKWVRPNRPGPSHADWEKVGLCQRRCSSRTLGETTS